MKYYDLKQLVNSTDKELESIIDSIEKQIKETKELENNFQRKLPNLIKEILNIEELEKNNLKGLINKLEDKNINLNNYEELIKFIKEYEENNTLEEYKEKEKELAILSSKKSVFDEQIEEYSDKYQESAIYIDSTVLIRSAFNYLDKIGFTKKNIEKKYSTIGLRFRPQAGKTIYELNKIKKELGLEEGESLKFEDVKKLREKIEESKKNEEKYQEKLSTIRQEASSTIEAHKICEEKYQKLSKLNEKYLNTNNEDFIFAEIVKDIVFLAKNSSITLHKLIEDDFKDKTNEVIETVVKIDNIKESLQTLIGKKELVVNFKDKLNELQKDYRYKKLTQIAPRNHTSSHKSLLPEHKELYKQIEENIIKIRENIELTNNMSIDFRKEIINTKPTEITSEDIVTYALLKSTLALSTVDCSLSKISIDNIEVDNLSNIELNNISTNLDSSNSNISFSI